MIDGKIKGTGNSRYLKSVSDFKNLYPTYDAFVEALVAGTLPVDLNGVNADGWETQGTPLVKHNLLSGEVSNTIFGSDDDKTVSEALLCLMGKIVNLNTSMLGNLSVETGSFTGDGELSRTLEFHGTPKLIFISGSSYDFTGSALGRCILSPVGGVGFSTLHFTNNNLCYQTTTMVDVSVQDNTLTFTKNIGMELANNNGTTEATYVGSNTKDSNSMLALCNYSGMSCNYVAMVLPTGQESE